jgi:eukaryotic-like serine/threonine-protein kinase
MGLSVGTRLGPYEIVAPLGAGGMGEVYRARDTRLGRDVAIKVLPPHLYSNPDLKQRFEREARTVSQLQHPRICVLYDIGCQGEIEFLVMEYLEGENLAQHIQNGPLTLQQSLRIATEVTDALAKAHETGVVHRDLKPSNIMLTATGAKLVDFGIAKLLQVGVSDMSDVPTLSGAATHAGAVVGTAKYMSPEQTRGLPIDARSDLFSLGVVMYEMLAGRAPFEGSTHADLVVSILERHPPALTEHRPDIPAEMQSIVSRCLEKDPELRYASARSLLAELDRLKSGASGPRAAGQPLASSIAVLPFVNMSTDPENEFFCDGIAEELINALTKIERLRVAARTSTFAFKGRSGDLREIGRTLNVTKVLEGSVRKAGTRLRITAQLVNVADGYQLWAERYDRHMEDIFQIQDQITLAIVDALKVKLLGNEKAALLKRYTENVEAYQLSLKARHSWHRWTDDGFRTAVELFERALRVDRNYALAHFGLADCYIAWSHGVGFSPHEAVPKTKSLLETALQLDPDLPEAHAVLAIVLGVHDWDWAASDRERTRALGLNPRSPQVLAISGLLLTARSRFAEALPFFKCAVELDPLAVFWMWQLAEAYCGARDYEESLRQVRAMLELEPGYWLAHRMAGFACSGLGRWKEAVGAFEHAVMRSAGVAYVVGELGNALARAGRRDDALKTLHDLTARSTTQHIPPLSIACVHAGLDQRDQAFDYLERSLHGNDGNLALMLGWHPLFDSLRSDQRLDDLLGRMGLPSHRQVQTSAGAE